MKRLLHGHLLGFTLLFCTTFFLQAQQRIAVVDVKKVVDNYDEKIKLQNELTASSLTFGRDLDNKKAEYIKMTGEMGKLDASMNDLSLSASARSTARVELVKLSEKRELLARDINSAERRAQTELNDQKKAMEVILAREVKVAMDAVAKKEGFDLVFDKSYLPHSDYKSILYVSENVPDLSAKVSAQMNASQ